ncbi:hypothetical protein ACQP2Y_21660 [Actinoplanes sp. CA-051413]|uniref:hypothetical protein n=1 Tax=Actinoplanes sp. CA-051413 TaxID=3239899 RepID=UPI003D98C040
MLQHELPFKLEWLAAAGAKKPDVSVCPNGHLLITGRTCWSPLGFSDDLGALHCRMVEHCDAVNREAPRP